MSSKYLKLIQKAYTCVDLDVNYYYAFVKNLLLILVITILFGCNNRDRNIQIDISFKGTGEGDFEICLTEDGNTLNNFDRLNFHLYATTKNGSKRDVERSIYQKCTTSSICQYYKLGAYTNEEYRDIEENFVPGNIKTVRVEIFYDGEYDKPFIIKEFSNL